MLKKFSEVNIIENGYNAGFTIAANQGAKNSIGKYLFFLNPDTRLDEDSLKKMLKKADDIHELGALGPQLINENGIKQQSFWKEPTLTNTLLSISHLDFMNYNKNYKSEKFSSLKEVETLSGGAIFIKRSIFNEINAFNEDLFWMEDIDLCKRLRKKGLRNFYLPETKIIHYSGKSSEKNYKVALSNQLKSKIKFFKIYHSKISTISLSVVILIILMIKTTLSFIFCLSQENIE